MIPVIEREVVGKRQWIGDGEMADVLSIAGSAPGGIGVNASAFIGYRIAGIGGNAATVLGITMPTFLIIFALSLTFSHFQHNPKIIAALEGIHGAITALIIIAAYKMGKSAIFDKTTLLTALISVALLLATGIHPLLVIVAGLFIGIPLVQAKRRLGLASPTEKPAGNGDSESYKYADYFIAEGI
ncbi:chromate transporter [Paenibacillus sp. P26]|nr:chromate transporter [Paenibacillus sp. P26]